MNYFADKETPQSLSARKASLDEIRQVLREANSVLSIAHPFSDGDALGSQLAMHHYCKNQGKRSVCLNFDPLPETLDWMNGVSELVSSLNDTDNFDVIFLMETTDISRMGDRVSFFKRAGTRVHLDHHLEVRGLGDFNYLDPHASSTCEILYDLLKSENANLPMEVMEPLYIGIMTDTGNFRYSNTTLRAHQIAGEMIQAGLNAARLYKHVYECHPFQRMLIHGLAMSRTMLTGKNKLLYTWLTQDDFRKTGATQVDADGAINHLCVVNGTEVALLFREQEEGNIKVSFRSNGKVDVQVISKRFGGGGHRQAAGAKVAGTLEQVIKTVVSAVEPLL